MAGKKKSMDGGNVFDFLKLKSSSNIETKNSNTYLSIIKGLADSKKNSVNQLNINVKYFNKISRNNKRNEHKPLLEQVKLILIEKIILSISEFIQSKFTHSTINFSELLGQLQEFEKLLNLLKLLDKKFDLSFYNPHKKTFINSILSNYEYYIQSILHGNPNTNILQRLNQEVQNYISEYSQFVANIANKRGTNNSINTIIRRLTDLSNEISRLSTNSTQKIKN